MSMVNLFDIKNKIFIITGASSGIGKKLCEEIYKYGGKVYGFSRRKLKTKNYKYIQCDLKNHKKFEVEIKKIYHKEKKISVLINCAGITHQDNLTSSIKKFDDVINTNLKVPFLLSVTVSKFMKRGGSIINICSISSYLGFPNSPGYVASKGGLKQLSKALALDLAIKKIRVNNIIPSYIKTPMTIKSYKNKKRNQLIKNKTILKRWGTTDDLVGPIIFLSSASSSYMTGSDIFVDGGWYAKGL